MDHQEVRQDSYLSVVRERNKTMIKKVPDALSALGDIYRERNAVYGDTYKNFGRVMKGFFPDPVALTTEEDWNRMALFLHCADKLARYAGSFSRGGHVDSLDDLSVYSQMLQEYDAEARTKSSNFDFEMENTR